MRYWWLFSLLWLCCFCALSDAVGHIVYSRYQPVELAGVATFALPRLYVMEDDGSGSKLFFNPGEFYQAKDPRWAPDYQHLLFTSDWKAEFSCCTQDIFLAKADGTAMLRVTGDEFRDPAPKQFGTISGVVVDNLYQPGIPGKPDSMVFGRTAKQIMITAKGWGGKVVNPQDNATHHYPFALTKVPAGKAWVKIWCDKSLGYVGWVDVQPNAVVNLGEVPLNNGLLWAAKPSMSIDAGFLSGTGGMTSVDAAATNPIAEGKQYQISGVENVCIFKTSTGEVLGTFEPKLVLAPNDPCISPDGKWVAMNFGQFGTQSLVLITPEDLIKQNYAAMKVLVQGQNILTTGLFSCGTPSWSADSKRIVFTRIAMLREIVAGEICVVNVDGTGLRQLTNVGAKLLCGQPCFSPDGSKIAFTVAQGNFGLLKIEHVIMRQFKVNIFTMNSDGTGIQQLTNDGISAEPAWGK